MSTRPPKAPPVAPHPDLTVLDDYIAYDGRFPVQIVRFTYKRFDGTQSGPLTWELWRRGRGVAVLPYDAARDEVALIEQFRLPAHAAGEPPVMTECAAGLLDADEDPAAAALRECAEETGLTPERLEFIGNFMLMQGQCDEMMWLYAGRVAIPPEAAASTHGLPHENESTRVLVMPAEDAFALLDQNRIRNAIAAICLYWLRTHRQRLRREWA